jgi:hypothetical protein
MEPTVIWGPGISGPILLTQVVLFLLSVVRLVSSAKCLYLSRGTRISPEDVLAGKVDSGTLAASGLANRLPCKAFLQKRDCSELAPAEGAGKLPYAVEAAESRFLYLWERCHANVDSARRAAILTFLLTLVMAAYSAYPRYLMYFNNSKRTGSWAAFLAAMDLLTLLGDGWAFCAVLYLSSSFFERALIKLRINWTYFCARLKNELSHG